MPKKQRDEVAIIGFTHRPSVPGASVVFDMMRNEEVWGFNHLFDLWSVGRFDRWFELHDLGYLKKVEGMWADHLMKLRGIRMPLYMQKKHKDIPASRVFPREAIEKLTPQGWYHMSSVDWMLAFAILEGFKTVHIYGVSFGVDEAGQEPLTARACLEYWIGVAQGRGMAVNVYGSHLFKWLAYEEGYAQYGYNTKIRNVTQADYGWQPPE